MTTSPTPVLQLQGLTKRYGNVIGVQNLDLTVNAGEIFGFLGPNGAGKTTTIRLIAGFLRPTSGSATILGMDVWRESSRVKAELGFLPDVAALYENLTGANLLDFLANLQKKEPMLKTWLCQQLEMSDRDLARPVKEYSRGMKQKVGLIQALQHDPAFLVLDEPTEGLDPLMQLALFGVLRDFQQRGHTVFMSSHVLSEVERMCSRVAMIRGGVLVVVEEVEALRKRSVRHMEVELRGPVDSINRSIPGVESVEINGNWLRITVRGDLNPLLQELGRLDVADLVYERPRLEDIFLDYYRGDHVPGAEDHPQGL